MTKHKSSKKSVQMQFGFMSEMDKEIYASEHDEIMLWVDRNIRTILSELNVVLVGPELRYASSSLAKITKQWEAPVTGLDKNLVGFTDMLVDITWDGYKRIIYFEVKTKISIGALIRQLRMYQLTNTPSLEITRPLLIVVSPDDRYKDILAEQGFLFVKYEPERLP